MKLLKTLQKLSGSNLVLLAGIVALAIALFHYSNEKGSYNESARNRQNVPHQSNGMPSHIANPPQAPGVNNPQGPASCCVGGGGPVQPSQPLGHNEVYSGANGLSTSVQGLPASCSRQQVVDPKELLPKGNGNNWAKLNPMGAGDLKNVNLLQAGYHIGIDTVGQSLRNANLQLRSEPPNPQVNVGPWNNTTIEPDFNRRPLEIGCGPN